MNESTPPLERSIGVTWDQKAAFERFTAQFGAWWPYRTHSIGGSRIHQVVFEGKVGGRIYEEHVDGRRFQWGTVITWDPPSRVRFTWHPSQDPASAQEVEVAFLVEGAGTRLVLTHYGWEKLGAKAARARRAYGMGWAHVLSVWAGRRTAPMILLTLVSGVLRAVGNLRSGDPRDQAKGEMQPARVKESAA